MAVELVKDGNAVGNFITVQIKSGAHYLKEEDEEHLVFRANDLHLTFE